MHRYLLTGAILLLGVAPVPADDLTVTATVVTFEQADFRQPESIQLASLDGVTPYHFEVAGALEVLGPTLVMVDDGNLLARSLDHRGVVQSEVRVTGQRSFTRTLSFPSWEGSIWHLPSGGYDIEVPMAGTFHITQTITPNTEGGYRAQEETHGFQERRRVDVQEAGRPDRGSVSRAGGVFTQE